MSEIINISKDKALKSYQNASEETKKILEDLIGKEVLLQNTYNKIKTVKNGKEAVIVGDTSLCVGDPCTTRWEGNGEMRIIGFLWDYDHPIEVIRLSDSSRFCFMPSDLIAYVQRKNS